MARASGKEGVLRPLLGKVASDGDDCRDNKAVKAELHRPLAKVVVWVDNSKAV